MLHLTCLKTYFQRTTLNSIYKDILKKLIQYLTALLHLLCITNLHYWKGKKLKKISKFDQYFNVSLIYFSGDDFSVMWFLNELTSIISLSHPPDLKIRIFQIMCRKHNNVLFMHHTIFEYLGNVFQLLSTYMLSFGLRHCDTQNDFLRLSQEATLMWNDKLRRSHIWHEMNHKSL